MVTAIGGDNRYYTMNFLWWLRELLDWLVGGPGFTHGRRHPTDLRIGDAIDYWTVIGMERERRLTLNFGMRAPGAGILEFEIEPLAGRRSRVTVTAYWHPQGVWGLLYWYALVPAHLFIFDRMTRAIVQRAEVQASLPPPVKARQRARGAWQRCVMTTRRTAPGTSDTCCLISSTSHAVCGLCSDSDARWCRQRRAGCSRSGSAPGSISRTTTRLA